MIEIITSTENEKWNEIVKSFDNHDAYYSYEYVKAFKLHGDGEPILFYFKNENIKAMNVAMKRDIGKDNKFVSEIKEDKYYDLITPYGYGGFIIEGELNEENIEELKAAYEKKCKEENIVSEFVRFHPVLKNHESVNKLYEITELGKTITVYLRNKEEIWSNFHGKNRNVIRKAKNSGVEIFLGRSPDLYEKFKKMYNETMDRDAAEDYYYFKDEFYDSLLNDLKYNSIIFYATYKEKIISMAIILHSNNQLHYHLSASLREYQRLAPTNLLLYEVAIWGNENDYETFHLGGGLGSAEDNLYRFKKAFNRYHANNYFIGSKIFNEEVYNYLSDIRKKSGFNGDKINFFPVYRG